MPSNINSIAIGMGLGDVFENSFLKESVVDSKVPIVLDADALSHRLLIDIIKKQQDRETVITPHPKEFSKLWKLLTGEELSVEYIQKNRFDVARAFGERFPNVVLVLKGANSLIVKADRVYLNPLGQNRLAKGGSGDVLSGLIASLLAQGYKALASAINGSLVLSIASNHFKGNDYSLTALDIIEELKQLIKK
jgi:hydroxyethylthiazole kinase-like uncharacterized protein yjeF